MKTYSKAPDEVYDRAKHIIKLFYPELLEAGLRLDILSVAGDEEDVPVLTHQGYGAAAVVSVVNIKGRTMGRGDAEIIIDECLWLKKDPAEKDALLDHEIHHIQLRTVGKSLVVILDERGRPKLKLKKHDRQFGWFDTIAARHGMASGEVKQAMTLMLQAKQIYFNFEVMPAAGPALLEGKPLTKEKKP